MTDLHDASVLYRKAAGVFPNPDGLEAVLRVCLRCGIGPDVFHGSCIVCYDAGPVSARMLKSQQEIIEAKSQEWISVKDRLPSTGTNVWVVWSETVQTIAYHRIGLGFACADGYQWEPAEFIDSDPIPDGEVTHWQPLPEPPKAGQL